MQVLTIPIANGSELPPVIQAFATGPSGGVITGPGLSPAAAVEIIRLAAKYRLLAVYSANAYLLSEGALVTYGGDASTSFGASQVTSIAYCAVLKSATWLCNTPRGFTWESISRPPRRLGPHDVWQKSHSARNICHCDFLRDVHALKSC
jgi:hypothetical protein